MTNDQDVRQSFELAFQALGEPDEPALGALRRGGADDDAVMTIIERNGVLHVEQGATNLTADVRSARVGETVVWERQLTKLDRNEISGWLANLDQKLTPALGL